MSIMKPISLSSSPSFHHHHNQPPSISITHSNDNSSFSYSKRNVQRLSLNTIPPTTPTTPNSTPTTTSSSSSSQLPCFPSSPILPLPLPSVLHARRRSSVAGVVMLSTTTITASSSPVKIQFRKTQLCAFFKSGKCSQSEEDCPFAHSLASLRNIPDLSKTKICPYGVHCLKASTACPYAHTVEELRSTNLFFRTKPCRFFKQTGSCVLGGKCRFAHNRDNEDDDIREEEEGEEEEQICEKINAIPNLQTHRLSTSSIASTTASSSISHLHDPPSSLLFGMRRWSTPCIPDMVGGDEAAGVPQLVQRMSQISADLLKATMIQKYED